MPELPKDLAALDRLLADTARLGPIVEWFRCEAPEDERALLSDGRPTVAMGRSGSDPHDPSPLREAKAEVLALTAEEGVPGD